MAFLIPAHGVRASKADPTLSIGQYRLLHDPAAIRFVGAPTGAGKTYAFIRAAAAGQFVVFVVPTQSLAADIARSANALRPDPPLAYVWDGQHSAHLKEDGTGVWYARKKEFARLRTQGGLVITTPETLGQIVFNIPYQAERERLDIAMLLGANHFVFDETHIYGERAWGFLHFWMTAVAARFATYPTHLTFLSATHSNMWDNFANDPEVLPSALWTQFDEPISETAADPGFRWLHGNVQVSVHPHHAIRELAQRILPHWLAAGHRILILYDSLRDLAADTPILATLMRQAGISPEFGYVITGQDRQSQWEIGQSGLRAGVQPDPATRLIIGTSAVEMGVSYERVTHAIMNPGMDAAAWLQRIGRIARGAVGGEIMIAEPRTAVQGFYQQLLTWNNEDGQHSIEDIRKTLGVLRKVDGSRAAVLGAAYWGMLKRHVRPVYVFLQEAHDSLTETPMPRDGLSAIHRRAGEIGGRQGDQVLQWIQAVDRTLMDVRGFLPTVQFQFQNGPIITYSREWVLQWLDPPDRISDQGVWEYDRPRPDVLRDQPVIQIERWALLPNGDIKVIPINLGRTGEAHALDVYRQYIRASHLTRELREAIHEWVRRSQLIILASNPLSPTDSAIL